MFRPEGFASFADPPVASSDAEETFAAELTERKLIQDHIKIQPYLVRRGPIAVDRWF